MTTATPSLANLDAFSETLRKETDRACGVLGSALLEEKLQLLFKRRLRHSHDELLGPMRPLGSFSARIRTAHALAWISDAAARDLDTVRSIRNKFAHSFDHTLGFDNQSIADLCRNLKAAQAYIDGHDDPNSPMRKNVSEAVIRTMRDAVSSPRWRYELTVNFVAQHLDDIQGDSSLYAGPDLLAECYALSARSRLIIRAEGTSQPPRTT